MRSGALFYVLLAILGLVLAMLVFGGEDGRVAGLPEGDFASLAYYGTWLLALSATFFFAMRTRFAEALKGLGLWLVAFLVLIAAYSFAPEFRELKTRVTAALMPGSVVELGGSDEDSRFMAARGMDDHFRVNGEIEGRPVTFLVDTGASTIAMDRRAAEHLGLEPDQLTYAHRVTTANGIARAARVTLDEVRVGGIVRRNVSAAITDGEDLGVVLLGMSFLSTLSSFDFRGDRLILTD